MKKVSWSLRERAKNSGMRKRGDQFSSDIWHSTFLDLLHVGWEVDQHVYLNKILLLFGLFVFAIEYWRIFVSLYEVLNT